MELGVILRARPTQDVAVTTAAALSEQRNGADRGLFSAASASARPRS